MWTELSKASLISIPVVGALCGLLCLRTAYATYRLVGHRCEAMNFSWFYTALQSPWYAKQVWGQPDIAELLPDELKLSVDDARRRINRGMAASIVWTILALCFSALATHIQSRI